MYTVCYVPSFCFKKQAMGALTKGDRRAEIGSLDSFNNYLSITIYVYIMLTLFSSLYN